MKDSLLNNLVSYSGLASSLLVISSGAEAQIIYTDPPDILLAGVGAHDSIDLNNDGNYDIKISIFDSYPSSQGFGVAVESNHAEVVEVFDYSNCQGIFFYGYGVVPFKPGKAIPQVEHFQVGWQPAYYGEILNWDYYGGTCHKWSNSHHKFMAVRIQSSPGHYNYAWVRLSVNTYGNKVKIHDWAYDTVVDDTLYTGQTFKLGEASGLSSNEINIYSYGKKIFITDNREEFLTVTIYNSSGQLMKSLKTNSSQVTISVSEFPTGIYVVRTQSNSSIKNKLVAIE